MPRRLLLSLLPLLLAACSTGLPAEGPAIHHAVAAEPSPSPSPSPPFAPPPLTLTGLFHPAPMVVDPTHLRTLVVTGDMIPARMVNVTATRMNDFLWPYRPTSAFVGDADITFTNLETPLFAGCPEYETGFTFCGDPRFVNGLVLDHVTVANLANNHAGNFGTEGIDKTVALLDAHGIKHTGLGPPAIVDVRGLKFAFLGFNGVGQRIDREALKEGIQYARSLADVVVVQFHWGEEYQPLPVPAPGLAPDDPVQIGHLAIDDGADLVIGNHPHWIQPIEIYKGKLITYAHGNFIFDQTWSVDTMQGVVGTYTFYDNQLLSASWKPVQIVGWGQATWMAPGPAAKILQTMEDRSRQLAAKLGEPTD